MKLRKEFVIGIIATFTLAGAYLGYNFLQGKDLFNRTKKYYVIYDKVAGLMVSNSVDINGLKVGLVSHIDFVQNDSLHRILVELSINKNIAIPKNSIARIKSDFLGMNTISLQLSHNHELYHEGDTLPSAIATTIQEEVSMQMLPIKVKTENMLASLDSVLEAVKYVFNKETQKNLASTFKRIQTTITNIESSSYTLDQMMTGQKGVIEAILGNVNSITYNLKNNNDKINTAISNFAAMSDTLAQLNLKSTVEKADKALGDFQLIVNKINKGEGSLGKLLNNDTLYYELEGASHELNKLVEDIKYNPQRYVHFSLFGRSPKHNVYVDPDSLKKP